MKKIIYIGLLLALVVTPRVEAQERTPVKSYLRVAPEEEDVQIAPSSKARFELGPLDMDISGLMNGRHEVPDSLYPLMRLLPEFDEDPTVVIKLDKYGKAMAFYRMKNGGWAVDTAFNISGLLFKIARAVDDKKRNFILMRDFPVNLEEEFTGSMPFPTDDPDLDLSYIGDPKFFFDGAPTPKRELRAMPSVHFVITLPEETAKKVQEMYDASEQKVLEHMTMSDEDKAKGKDKDYTDARNDFTKSIVMLLVKPSA